MRERRLSFGEVAELYDESRPSYPSALVEDLVEIADLGASDRLLEIGAGTGKATILFGSRGLPVLAIEPSSEMAVVAQRNCAAYPNVTIEQADFEHWRPHGERFPLLYSAQAWHWISRDVRYPRAREVLVEGGTLAAYWNRPDWESCHLRSQLRAAYQRAAPEFAPDGPMHPSQAVPPGLWGHWTQEIAGAAGFEQPSVRDYRWPHEYRTSEYLALLQTHSDHHLLDRSDLAALLDAVADVLDRNGGRLRLTYITQLCLARAR